MSHCPDADICSPYCITFGLVWEGRGLVEAGATRQYIDNRTACMEMWACMQLTGKLTIPPSTISSHSWRCIHLLDDSAHALRLRTCPRRSFRWHCVCLETALFRSVRRVTIYGSPLKPPPPHPPLVRIVHPLFHWTKRKSISQKKTPTVPHPKTYVKNKARWQLAQSNATYVTTKYSRKRKEKKKKKKESKPPPPPSLNTIPGKKDQGNDKKTNHG